MAQCSAVSVDEKQIREHFNREIGTARCSMDACNREVSFVFSLQRVDVMNNVRKACQYGELHLMYLEPIQHIKIISDFCPSNRILVYDELGTNPLQKDCFKRKKVHAVRVVMKV